MFFLLALTAVLMEALFGYPKWLMRMLGHPVMWLGRLIAWCDTHLNKPTRSDTTRRLLGVLTLTIVVAVAVGTAALFSAVVSTVLSGTLAATILATIVIGCAASTLIASRSLHTHVNDVANALEHDGLEAGRAAVSNIVGRDTSGLDEPGIARAAIESLAENFSDGVVTPVFWLFVAGLPGIIAYKAINTLDSMIGHMSDKHRAFGWASATTDDLANLPGTLLAQSFLIWAAAIHPNASALRAWDTRFRHGRGHRSFNAAIMETTMAGALGITLGGPRVYDGNVADDPWIGDGRKELTPTDIKTALQLFRLACVVQAIHLAAFSALIWYLA